MTLELLLYKKKKVLKKFSFKENYNFSIPFEYYSILAYKIVELLGKNKNPIRIDSMLHAIEAIEKWKFEIPGCKKLKKAKK